MCQLVHFIHLPRKPKFRARRKANQPGPISLVQQLTLQVMPIMTVFSLRAGWRRKRVLLDCQVLLICAFQRTSSTVHMTLFWDGFACQFRLFWDAFCLSIQVHRQHTIGLTSKRMFCGLMWRNSSCNCIMAKTIWPGPKSLPRSRPFSVS